MTIADIVADLSVYQEGVLPKEALLNAAQHWADIWPQIRASMQDFADEPSSFSEEQSHFLFMGILLVVQQCEYEAFPLLLDICNRQDEPDSELDYLFGDALTELLPSYLYILSQDDVELLDQLICSQLSGSYVKSAAMLAIFAKHESGQISRDRLTQLIRTWLDLFAPQDNEISAHFLGTLAASCINGDLHEFKQELVELAEAFKIEPNYISPMEIEDWIVCGHSSIKSGFIKIQLNVIDELSRWAAFRTAEENEVRNAELYKGLAELRKNSTEMFDDLQDDWDYERLQTPYVAPTKIGRNDPCPCGSGKKYKKCCMAS